MRIKINRMLSIMITLLLPGALAADISISPASPNVEQTVIFNVSQPGYVVHPETVTWIFGDTNSTKGQATVSHVYQRPGTWQVQVDYGYSLSGNETPNFATEYATVTVVERRRIDPERVSTSTGQEVSLTAVNFLSRSIRWDFGDGSATRLAGNRVSHVYLKSGVFTVTALDQGGDSKVPITATVSVDIDYGRRTITFAPERPLVGGEVVFTARDFFSDEIRWDFGDGTPALSGTNVARHTFAIPGTYQVRAWDWGGRSGPPVTVAVSVDADYGRRSILLTSGLPLVSTEIVFTARDFFSDEIRWDFGDGTPALVGASVARHTFAIPGTYQVRAWDWGGRIGPPVIFDLTVFESGGPIAPFHISFLQIRFADGLTYKVVPRGFEGLTAYVDLKYEGTGFFQAQWLVDGMPFQLVSQALTFAGSTTIDSGAVPGLPTQVPGLHEVSLRIMEPRAELIVPVIRYFVSAASALPVLEGVALEFETVKGIRGVKGAYEMDRLILPSGHTYILNGALTWTEATPLHFGLLRIHLGDKLIDQQLIRSLQTGEKRPFSTSVQKDNDQDEALYITLYDISQAASPILLFLQRIDIKSVEEKK